MANGSNNENFKNKLTKELKEKIQKSVRDSFEKKGGYKAYNEELKKDEEKNRDDYLRKMNDVPSPSNRFNVDPRSPEALRSGLAADRARIQNPIARETEAQRIKEEAIKKAEKEIGKKIQKHPRMKRVKGKIAAKVASRITGEAAYTIAQKMAQKANAGGSGAIIIILFTVFLATTTDVIDILVEIGFVAFVVSIIGTIPGVVLRVIIWFIDFLCAFIILIFWTLVLGGGHKKWFWKRVIRMLIVLIGLESLPGIGLLPLATLMVFWNWYDFAKDKKKAKDDLRAFESEFKKTRKIKPKYVKEYV